MYKELGDECVQVGCSVDLFITNNSFIDLATIGQISKTTGGEIFKYTYFQASDFIRIFTFVTICCYIIVFYIHLFVLLIIG